MGNVLSLKSTSLGLLNKSERSGYFDSISNHETIYFLHPKSKSYYNIQISSAKVEGILECYACPSSWLEKNFTDKSNGLFTERHLLNCIFIFIDCHNKTFFRTCGLF